MADKTFVGVGSMFVAGRKIENPTTMAITVETEDLTIPNTSSVGGGNYRKLSRASAVRIEATIHDYSGDSVALLLKGGATDVAAAAIDQDITAVSGRLVPLDNLLDTSAVFAVAQNGITWGATTAYALGTWAYVASNSHIYEATTAGTSAGTEPTWPTNGTTVTDGTVVWTDRGLFAAVSGTDYIAWATGIEIVAGGGIPDGAPITVTGTSYAHSKVETLTAASTEYEVAFDGVNEDGGEPLSAYFTKVVWDPASVDLIQSGEFGSPTLAGEVLPDSTRPAGRSKFGTLRFGDATIL